jgi:hypothetical protein
LERWTQRIGREHRKKGLSRGELWDHLPHFFDELLAALGVQEDSSDLRHGGYDAIVMWISGVRIP